MSLRIVGNIFIVLFAVGTLRADHKQTLDLMSPVQKGLPTTYLELLQKIMPDAKADLTANNTIPLRSISEPRRNEPIAGAIKFDVEPFWFNSEGRKLLMLRVELRADEANVGTPYEGEAVVLALFKLEPTASLLDALEIKTDRFASFWEDRPLFRLDSRNDAFIVSSSHWHAGESYSSLDMLFVDEGRIKSIASQFIFETQGCGTTFTETPSFRAIASSVKKS